MQRGQGTNFRATGKELTNRGSREILDPDWLWMPVHSLMSSRLKAEGGGAGIRSQRPKTPVTVSHSHPRPQLKQKQPHLSEQSHTDAESPEDLEEVIWDHSENRTQILMFSEKILCFHNLNQGPEIFPPTE